MNNCICHLSKIYIIIDALYFIFYFINPNFATSTETLFKFIENDSEEASVYIDIQRFSNYVVSEKLFGKFSENIGKNIYGGLWAQILENPSLEPPSTFKSDTAYNKSELENLKTLTHKRIPIAPGENNISYRWLSWNGEWANYKLINDSYNTSYSLAINVEKFPDNVDGVGIRQPIFLPIKRNKTYNLSFFVKEASAPIVAVVSDARNPEKIFSKIIIVPPQSHNWEKISETMVFELSENNPTKPLWFCIGLGEKGSLKIDQINLFPADSVEGFDPEVISLARDAKISILRFPGGNYASGYHWKDDLAPMDKRPTTLNPAWHQCDPHCVGTDEHIKFCRLIGAEPLICINAGNGTPEEAGDWVEYCNGSTSTKWGKIRAERGFLEPYNVKLWELGNELWGPWQIGNCSADEYAIRYRKFYNAMKSVDPSIQILACGHNGDIIPEWNDTLINKCGDILHSITLHFLFSNNPRSSSEYAFLSQMGYAYILEDLFRNINAKGKSKGIDLKVAITEEMIFNGMPHHPRPETISEALYYAGTLTSAIRTEGIVEIFTHSALINHGGGLKKERGIVYPEPVHYAFKELRTLTGTRPTSFTVYCKFSEIPDWQSSWAGNTPKKFPLIDIMPLQNNKYLYIVLLNKSPNEQIILNFNIKGENFKEKLRIYELTGDSFLAMNDVTHPERIKPCEKVLNVGKGNSFKFKTNPFSLYVISFHRETK